MYPRTLSQSLIPESLGIQPFFFEDFETLSFGLVTPLETVPGVLKIKKFCRRTKNKFYLSNNIRLSIRLGLNGVYIPSFNKKINYGGNYSLPKSFKIIGSAHSFSEIIIKKKQMCDEIFLSPIFKVNKSKKFLDISKFNLMTLNNKIDFIALGGINQKNYKKIKLLKSNGFASISWAKKNGLIKIRPF